MFIASTDGDNTNLIIAQIAQKRFGVEKVIVRVMDPARANWYGEQGLDTISPTKHAIEMFERAPRTPRAGLRAQTTCTRSSSEPARWGAISPAS